MAPISVPPEASTDALLEALPPRAKEKFEASEEAYEMYQARSRARQNKRAELQADAAAAQQYLRKMEDHPQATTADVQAAQKDVDRARAKVARHDAKAPRDTSSFAALRAATGTRTPFRSAIQKWRASGANFDQPPFRDVERQPDADEPDNHPDAVAFYAHKLKQVEADAAGLQGRVLPKKMVEERVRSDFRRLLGGGGSPQVGATRRLAKHHREDGKLSQGGVQWPERSRLFTVQDGIPHYTTEPDLAQILLWAFRDEIEAKLIAEACNYDDTDELDLATRDQKLAALEVEGIRLTRNAEFHLAFSNGAAERTWRFDAMAFLGIEVVKA